MHTEHKLSRSLPVVATVADVQTHILHTYNNCVRLSCSEGTILESHVNILINKQLS